MKTHTHTHVLHNHVGSLSNVCPSLQHAELTESFKKYLESKGLEEVLIYNKAYWPVVGVLCELPLLVIVQTTDSLHSLHS